MTHAKTTRAGLGLTALMTAALLGAATLGTATLAPPSAAWAEETRLGTATLGAIAIEGAWMRQSPPRATAGAAWMTIRNTGETDDVLLGGSAPFAARLEVHEMAVTDGVMTMRMLADGIPIPAGETVTLEPGGLHVMFMGLQDAPVANETAELTLRFAEAGEVTLRLPVAAIGAGRPAMGDDDHHGGMHGDAAQ